MPDGAGTSLWLVKAGALAVLGIVGLAGTGWWFLGELGRAMGSTGHTTPTEVFPVAGLGLVCIGSASVVFARSARRVRVFLTTTLAAAALLVVFRGPLEFGEKRAREGWAERNGRLYDAELTALRSYVVREGDVTWHYLWEDDLLVRVKAWSDVVQANPLGVRQGEVFHLWTYESDFALDERRRRLASATDAAGRSFGASWSIEVEPVSRDAYRTALRNAQRAYNH